jgi:hypothetical protein
VFKRNQFELIHEAIIINEVYLLSFQIFLTITVIFIMLSALRQSHSLFQSKFYGDCELVLSYSFSGFLFPLVHLAAANIFLLFPLLLHFLQYLFFQKQFLLKMLPIQSAFLLSIVCRIFLSSLTVPNTVVPGYNDIDLYHTSYIEQ